MHREEKSTGVRVNYLVRAFLDQLIEPQRSEPNFVMKQLKSVNAALHISSMIIKERNVKFILKSLQGDVELTITMGKPNETKTIIVEDGVNIKY